MDETMANEQITFTPIGYFRSSQVHPYEAGRQPDEHHAEGSIELISGQNFEQALTGLEGCERLWVVFLFHHNPHWNPMVLPPRGSDTKLGVFATRSPYRPNPIGISCVRLLSVNKLTLKIAGADILNGTPILDIKPYVAYADSFPGVEPAWLQESSQQSYSIGFSENCERQLSWLEQQGLSQLRSFLLHQLQFEPTNKRKKRVKPSGNSFVLAYRTWRAQFRFNHERELEIEKIFSGYSEAALANDDDPYEDKILHRGFTKLFPAPK